MARRRSASCWSCGAAIEPSGDGTVALIAKRLGGKRACEDCRLRLETQHDTWVDRQLRKLIDEES
jgi:hypothetical protein